MKIYRAKIRKLTGTDFREVRKKALNFYKEIKNKSRRKTYLRSSYFKKDKIFLDLFWHHLFENKNFTDQTRRLKFFPCALELIQKSHFEPTSKQNPNRSNEILHRFACIASDRTSFYVQIKENKRTGKKWLISIFPA